MEYGYQDMKNILNVTKCAWKDAFRPDREKVLPTIRNPGTGNIINLSKREFLKGYIYFKLLHICRSRTIRIDIIENGNIKNNTFNYESDLITIRLNIKPCMEYIKGGINES